MTCVIFTNYLIRMTYLTIYQIEYPIKLNKRLTTLIKMTNGFYQVGHLVKLEKANDILDQNVISFWIKLDILC